ncbi:Dolichyl-diphosphooligosaccharide--protein glycosyltransferase subunit 2 [Acorus calamus]|uniref:Dolichyl-diphosphooligosaccharide--protein glycosyltransferase subunit 2 n=1 Tax=Acorus calamus TaxID=4465 RepID=A0AAV9DS00_ACOCL|nr:Dolichyl-diphosphooligosaccharide--protein glycosyltransferase subunit 2 [Acorus calamus]
MARDLVLLFLISLLFSACDSKTFSPISDGHRSAASELFVPIDGSYGSLEDTYKALRTFHILKVDRNVDINSNACPVVSEILKDSSSNPKDVYFALGVNSMLGCQIDSGMYEALFSRLQSVIKGANSLYDFYYSIKGLLVIKDQGINALLENADVVFHSIKSLSQSGGRWRFSSDDSESSTYAAGLALEALAGVVSLADSEIDQSMISIVKNDIVKLFDSIDGYDDGVLYFDEKLDVEYHDPLSTSASVVQGLTAFAAVASGNLKDSQITGDKILGLANFFLSIGIPGTTKDFYNQIESVACLEDNVLAVPLILSLPTAVISATSKDQLKVKVTTVLGSVSPPLTVKLVQAFSPDTRHNPVLAHQELRFDPESSIHSLDILPTSIHIGKYIFVFEILLHDPEHKNVCATGGQTQAFIYYTGLIKIESAEIAILDSDVESVETKQKLDLSRDNTVSLSANHLQKIILSFHLTTPLGHAFKPHQAFLKLRHETKVEHMFVLKNTGKHFEIKLDLLRLVEKFYYLSGKYDIELTVGDISMENSFLRAVGHVDLHLPEPSDKATRPPVPLVDPYSRFGPKPEIFHIFRAPEKRPPQELSYAFLAVTLLPFLCFLIGLMRLGVNLKNFPSSALPATFSILFHAAIAGVLLLYVLFWLKLDLFTTLKILSFLGVFLVFVGHRTLSYHASTSTKQKSA